MHLRIHMHRCIGPANKFKATQKPQRAAVYRARQVVKWNESRGRYVPLKTVRVVWRACDGQWTRFDETARAGEKLIDCPRCAAIADLLLSQEKKKPLTWRRRNLLLKEPKGNP